MRAELQNLLKESKEIMGEWKTNWVGNDIICYEKIDSTNLQAKRLAKEGYGNGTLVVAECQESGRGRRGRSWESPLGTNISMSLLLKPEIEPNHASMITLVQSMFHQSFLNYFINETTITKVLSLNEIITNSF